MMRLPARSVVTAAAGACLLLTACASKAPAQDPAAVTRAPDEGARIVLFRECGALGLSAIRPDILLNDARIGPAHPSAYRVFEVAAGQHHVALLGQRARGLSLSLEPGDVAFVQAVVSIGGDLREGRLQLADAADAKRVLPTLARIDR